MLASEQDDDLPDNYFTHLEVLYTGYGLVGKAYEPDAGVAPN